jgi:hypothetical protein
MYVSLCQGLRSMAGPLMTVLTMVAVAHAVAIGQALTACTCILSEFPMYFSFGSPAQQ